MKLSAFEAIAKALQTAEVRYIVVGGLAVTAHGYLRYTQDVDLVVQLKPDNIIKALKALAGLGYKPRVPIRPEQFADPAMRDSWRRDKGMLVLNLFSDLHVQTPVDVFVYEPFDFDQEYTSALIQFLDPDLPIHFVSLATLLRLKQEAGRPQDLADIDQLKQKDDLE